MIRLTWKFSNDHQWYHDFDSFGEAHDAAYNFGLYSHPQVVHVNIKDLENENITGEINLVDRRELSDC
jgi:hypothetical protein